MNLIISIILFIILTIAIIMAIIRTVILITLISIIFSSPASSYPPTSLILVLVLLVCSSIGLISTIISVSVIHSLVIIGEAGKEQQHRLTFSSPECPYQLLRRSFVSCPLNFRNYRNLHEVSGYPSFQLYFALGAVPLAGHQAHQSFASRASESLGLAASSVTAGGWPHFQVALKGTATA
ncbi:hypothetical protein AK812_SmicGene2898 [Symbiodinium microadriaticum]|uniref:Uncharacterized protein n=1 Tax=Symbiodinium microadriaticum TaxID=2951 RepID=A0A1Q9F045_SYMMI|nr:hypothetical protein AK812_SmicGene2898 [Symbiodinium microadriaticum]